MVTGVRVLFSDSSEVAAEATMPGQHLRRMEAQLPVRSATPGPYVTDQKDGPFPSVRLAYSLALSPEGGVPYIVVPAIASATSPEVHGFALSR